MCENILFCFIVFCYILSFILMVLWVLFFFWNTEIQSINSGGDRGGENLGGIEEENYNQNISYEKN